MIKDIKGNASRNFRWFCNTYYYRNSNTAHVVMWLYTCASKPCTCASVCVWVCVHVGGMGEIHWWYQKSSHCWEHSEPRAKVDKKQWHQFSKIKRKPTVLLSASILEYKEGGKCWDEERAGSSLYITSWPDTKQWFEPLRAPAYIQISLSAC